MSNVLRLAIVDPNDSARDALKSILLGLDMVWLEAECSRYEFFADVVAQTHPDIGLVALDNDPDKALQLVEQLAEPSPAVQHPGRQRVDRRQPDPAGDAGRGQGVPSASRSGSKTWSPRWSGSASGASAAAIAKSRGSTVIAVAGATGGVGTTSVAVNLGCVLATDPQNSVALVDLDLSLGDADVFLDTIPDYTLVDVAQNVTRLDFTLAQAIADQAFVRACFCCRGRCNWKTRS